MKSGGASNDESQQYRGLTVHQELGFLPELVKDGATVMVSGFGEPGTPFYLLDALAHGEARGLTVIKNDANEPGAGVGQLLRAGMVSRLVASHIGLNGEMMAAMDSGEVAVDFHPQGILAEKIRCAGAGVPAFLSDIGVGVLPGKAGDKREQIEWRGKTFLLEASLHADVALIHAHQADHYGNLIYRKSARNFAPLMAMAAKVVVVEVEELRTEPLHSDSIHTPGCFVNHLIGIPPGFRPPTKAASIREERSNGR